MMTIVFSARETSDAWTVDLYGPCRGTGRDICCCPRL